MTSRPTFQLRSLKRPSMPRVTHSEKNPPLFRSCYTGNLLHLHADRTPNQANYFPLPSLMERIWKTTDDRLRPQLRRWIFLLSYIQRNQDRYLSFRPTIRISMPRFHRPWLLRREQTGSLFFRLLSKTPHQSLKLPSHPRLSLRLWIGSIFR